MENSQSTYTRRPLRIAWWFFLVTLILLIVFAYPTWRITTWLGLPDYAVVGLSALAFSSQYIARLLLRKKTSRWAFNSRRILDMLLGAAPILLVAVLLGELLILTTSIDHKSLAISLLIITALLSVYAIRQAHRPRIETLALSSDKIQRPIKLAQISDVHIGSRSKQFLRRVMHQVNSIDADALCITGDLIDQTGISEDTLSPLASFNGPIYFCIGNHERYEDLDQIIQRLESLNIKVLRNHAVIDEHIQFIGIDDAESKQTVANALKNIPVSSQHYSVLLYHRPHGLEDASRHGVDLKLSGHTHNGQIIPFNLAVNRVFKYRKGLYQYQQTHLYVNQGTGTWGPIMRLGSFCEVTAIHITPPEKTITT